MKDIAWDKLELIIFDVDGTIYNQSKLRKRILVSLLIYYSARPWKYKDLYILYHFRKEREKHAGRHFNSLEEEQYEWCSKKTGISISYIKQVIDKWIFNYPNKFLLNCMYPGAKEFIKTITDYNILTAVYSDYPAEKKMQMMNLDFNMLVSSTDHFINAMKPSVRGLDHIIKELNIRDRANCLFIGDRYELDGECANFAAIPFLLLIKNEADAGLYHKLADIVRNSRKHKS